MGALFQDVRYALRSLRRRPLLAAAAIASLALGIGVNTAIFSVFDRMVLRKLSVPAPDQIVLLSSPGRKPGGTSSSGSGRGDQAFSYPLFRDLEELPGVGLSRVVAHRDIDVNLGYRGRSSTGTGLLVSGGYFQVLGVSAAAGRLLTPEDDRVLDGHPVAVLAHDYWTTTFGADPRILGESIAINGRPYTIIGIGPRGFTGTTLMDRPDVFVPMAMAGHLGVGGVTRRDHWLYLFARLQPGVTRQEAQQRINGPFTALIRGVEFEELRSGLSDAERPAFLNRQMVLLDGSRSRQQAPDETRRLLSLLLVVTGLVLLIACANVANLMMTRATDRGAEIAIRLSIGASRGRLVRLLLVEAVLLGIAGGAAALGVAAGTHTALLSMMPVSDVAPLRFDFNLNILLFAGLLGIFTSLVFGLYGALHGVSAREGGSLQQATRYSATRNATRFRTSLATVQIGLATALLATAALFAGSLTNLSRADVGLDRQGVIAFRIAPHLNGYDAARARTAFDRLMTDLRATPGVTAASATSIPVLADEGWNQRVTVEGIRGGSDAETQVSTARIDTAYFQTLRIPLLAGREFTQFDTADAPRVAVVNRAFVRRLALGSEAVGRRFSLGVGKRPRDIEIVGVVEDSRYSTVRDEPPPQLFLPYRQAPGGPMTFYARATTDVKQLQATVPALVARIDPDLPVDHLRTLDDQIWENVAPDRVLTALSTSFALLAAVLAAIGLYAVLAFTVAQRLKEFGIRMALGAGPRDVRAMIARHVGRMAMIGTPIGVVAAIGLSRLAAALLYGVSGDIPLLIGGAAASMLVIVIGAAAVPIRRAMRVEPIVALRIE